MSSAGRGLSRQKMVSVGPPIVPPGPHPPLADTPGTSSAPTTAQATASYQDFAVSLGVRGWGFDNVLPYFIRAEDNARLSGPFHGKGGPLRVEDQRYSHEISRAFIDATVFW